MSLSGVNCASWSVVVTITYLALTAGEGIPSKSSTQIFIQEKELCKTIRKNPKSISPKSRKPVSCLEAVKNPVLEAQEIHIAGRGKRSSSVQSWWGHISSAVSGMGLCSATRTWAYWSKGRRDHEDGWWL